MTDVNYDIAVQDLNKNFKGNEKPAVSNLSLRVKRGEIFGFIGPNGSGKTTTMRMLCGLLTPDSGQGMCLGYNILTQSTDIKNNIGYMPQHFSLYTDLTVYENLNFMANMYAVENKQTAIHRILIEFNLMEYRDRLVGNLSGGWKQRLALACIILRKPRLLLLDEPTANIDPNNRREFWELLHTLSATGITTLVSTHLMDEAERCHRLAYIAYGHLLIEGTPQEIVQKSGVVTWAVTGDNLPWLEKRLKNCAGVEQLAIWGHNLHICGHDEAKLTESLTPFYKNASYQWQKITPNLEEVFINLENRQQA